MSVKDIFDRATSVISAERVYGPVQALDGLTVIPAASVRGGGGGGEGGDDAQSGEGGGFGVDARPVGAFVIDSDGVRWQPVIDIGRIVLGCQVVAVVWIWFRWRTEKAKLRVGADSD